MMSEVFEKISINRLADMLIQHFGLKVGTAFVRVILIILALALLLAAGSFAAISAHEAWAAWRLAKPVPGVGALPPEPIFHTDTLSAEPAAVTPKQHSSKVHHVTQTSERRQANPHAASGQPQPIRLAAPTGCANISGSTISNSTVNQTC